MKKYTYQVGLSLAMLFCFYGSVQAQGVALTGVGSTNRSMGGAATGGGVDAAGALHWNPAAIAKLDRHESIFGVELLTADIKLSSSLPTGQSGSEDSDAGTQPIPTMATVFKSDLNSDFTFGLGAYAIGGFRASYPSSVTSPISAPPSFGGLGRIVGEAEFFQIAPTVAYEITPRLSVGVAPTLTTAKLSIEPMVYATPNADGTYPSESSNRYTFGGGFQIGAHWQAVEQLGLGFSVKSPQWFENFRYNTVDENGLPRNESLEVEFPLILSTGVAYTGIENLVLALDLRYFDYSNAKGFKEKGFDETGASRGLGWDSVFGLNAGAEYRTENGWAVRAGYSYNENPIPNSQSVFNVASPLIQQHIASVGGSIPLTEHVELSLAYLYAFDSDIEGPIVTPQTGAIEGSSVKSELTAHAVAAALHIRH